MTLTRNEPDEPLPPTEALDDEDLAEGDGGDGGDDVTDEGPAEKPRKRGRSTLEWVAVIGGALLIALVVRTFFVQAFWIPSESMEPTLHKGDRVLVNKLSYKLHDVRRGDVIVFERPPNAPAGEDNIKDLIKRVIGLPGDTIETVDGVIHINGEPLDEPWLPDGTRSDQPMGVKRQVVPPDNYFVMGDNRSGSSDSRVFGTIDEGLIVGRAFVLFWPLGDIGGL